MTGFSSSCGACKFLRRRCTSECVFAPYYSYDHAASHFSAVHKVFGASNVSKLLLHLPVENRSDAAITLSYEALARLHDPVYGCVAQILALQKLVSNLEEEIEFFGNQMANLGVNPCSYEMYQETNILNEALQFSSEYDIMGNYVNHQNLQLQQTPNLLANQVFCSQMNAQFPQENFFENEILQAHCNSSAIDGYYEEVHQDIYLPSQWMSAA